jgi:DNA-directed RNA polymerase subunit E'/Rpb7
MDPILERRELVRNVHIEARDLQRNIQASLLAQLRLKYEGICIAEGYIKEESIQIIDNSLGRANLIKGGLDYTVRFHADVCFPHPGQKIRAPVVLKSKIGVHAEMKPLKILLPRDLHIGNEEFEQVEDKQEVELEVVGSRFQQGDTNIVVLGKLLNTVKPEDLELPERPQAEEPKIAASTSSSGAEVKKVVTVSADSVKSTEASRRRRIKSTNASETNESKSEGKTEGKD